MADKDLELLDNVELRFALSETDAQLEKTISIFLCPALLKLSSPHESVRNKVIGILSHINKRVKVKPSIKLPVSNLLQQYATNSSPLVKNFSLMYIEMGFERISQEERVAALPQLIKGIARRPPSQQMTLIHMLLLALASIKHHNEDNTESDPYEFVANPADAVCLLGRFQDVIMYKHTVTPTHSGHSNEGPSSPNPQAASTGQQPEASASVAGSPQLHGLSKEAIQFVTYNGKAAWTKTAELKEIKLGIMRFAKSVTAIPDAVSLAVHTERYILLIAATGDSYYEVSNLGDDGLKRTKLPSLDEKIVVDRLFALYQGTNRGVAVVGQENAFRGPASNVVKLKIMSQVSKSKKAASTFPSALQVSFDCLYGPETNGKLIMAGMAFVQWIARMATLAAIKPFGPILIQGLVKYTRENDGVQGMDAEATRGFAYVAVGLISKRVPEIFRTNLDLVEEFFSSIASQPPNVKTYIQESLCTLLEAFDPLSEWATAEDEAKIIRIIEDNIHKDEQHARYCAVKFATTLFPFSHLMSKYFCLMTITDDKIEIREEAKKGLTFPANFSKEPLPDFSKLVQLIGQKSKQLLSGRTDASSTLRPAYGKTFINGYPSDVYIHILQFLRRLLITSADREVISEESSNDYELQQFVFTPTTRRLVKSWLKATWDAEAVFTDREQQGLMNYIPLLEQGLNHQGSVNDNTLQSTALTCLLELVSLSPGELSKQYSTRLAWFKPFIGAPKVESRLAVAHIIGIVSSDHGDAGQKEAFGVFLNDLSTAAKDDSKHTTVELRHGSIVTLGYVLGRIAYRYGDQSSSVVSTSDFESYLQILEDNVKSTSNSVFVSGACTALGEVGRYAAFPETQGAKIVDTMIEASNAAKDSKVQETIITALGHIGVGNPSLAPKILTMFYDMGTKSVVKQVEIHFTVGEAIACIGAGWDCSSMDVHADLADVDPPHPVLEVTTMEGILSKILSEMTTSLKAATKKAACIWLLSLVKFCSNHSAVKQQLSKLHAVFSSLLSDRDEFTQEVASKGIGLVYELGDESVRGQLVESLVGMFGEGKRQAAKVTGETELFDGNTLGQAPDGSSLSTYQSILSLASDMNQPELVYKFMHLASHNSMWQSRKGAAFGFASIVSQAEAELQPYMSTLIPRLYRYQYDPNPKVNEAMTSIWKALVKEPKKAVQEYFDVIIKDLLTGLGAAAWRTRESSSLAMADLLQGRTVEEFSKYLEQVWVMSFRALDDIKESVRIAAFKACRGLMGMTLKYCDPARVTVAEGEHVLGIIVPFLVTKGILSSAEDVCKFSLTTILKICKQSGKLLRNHISSIIMALLDALTSMEPQTMNYLSFHTEKYQISQEQLEGSRLSAAKLSPMMEGIEACVDSIDETIMGDLATQLATTIRKAVGLPTKAGCAHLLISICIKKPTILKPHADLLLKVLSNALKDKSPAVRKSYAMAAGYMARIASDEALKSFIDVVGKRYIDSDEEDIRSISAVAVHEVSKNASDRFKSVSSTVLPTVYFGTFDANKTIQSVWKEVWEDNTAGSATASKLYANEIVGLISQLLGSSPSWTTKKQSAKALKGMSEVMDLGKFMPTLLPVLLDGLTGRTWAGKEAVVEAVAAVTVASKSYFEESGNNADSEKQLKEVAKALLRESKKVNKQYRRFALESLGSFLNAFPRIEYYDQAKTVVFKILAGDEDDMSEDEEHDKPMQLVVIASAAKTLGQIWTRNATLQAQYSEELVTLLAKSMVDNVWNVRSAVLESSQLVLQKLDLTSIDEAAQPSKILSESNILALLNGLEEGSVKDYKYITLRTQGMEVLKTLFTKLNENKQLITPAVKAQCLQVLTVVRKDPIPRISESAVELESLLD